jgi:hypothetical protein
MPNLDNDYIFAFDPKLETIIARSKAKVASQVSFQGLGSAHCRPFFQPLDQFQQPDPNLLGQASRLVPRLQA